MPVPRSSFVMPVSVLFDHDAKVSGDSAPFADFLAAGGQEPWAVCVKDWVGWAIATSRTRKVTRPAGRGLGRDADRDAVLQRPRCAGPILRVPYDPAPLDRRGSHDRQPRRLRQPARAGTRTAPWTASRIVQSVNACGIRGPTIATCCALIDSARSQKTDRTFMCELWVPHTPTHRPGGRPSRSGSACSG